MEKERERERETGTSIRSPVFCFLWIFVDGGDEIVSRDSDSNDRRSTGSSISFPFHARSEGNRDAPPLLPAIFIYRLARNDRSFPHGGNFVYTKEYRGLDGRTRSQNRFSSAAASMQRRRRRRRRQRRFFLSALLSFSRRFLSTRDEREYPRPRCKKSSPRARRFRF